MHVTTLCYSSLRLATRTWDETLLRLIFLSVDVNQILKIFSCCRYMMEAFVSWNFTKNGIFCVRSAYFVEWDHQHGRKMI
jgi:hypothetical protein